MLAGMSGNKVYVGTMSLRITCYELSALNTGNSLEYELTFSCAHIHDMLTNVLQSCESWEK